MSIVLAWVAARFSGAQPAGGYCTKVQYSIRTKNGIFLMPYCEAKLLEKER